MYISFCPFIDRSIDADVYHSLYIGLMRCPFRLQSRAKSTYLPTCLRTYWPKKISQFEALPILGIINKSWKRKHKGREGVW